MGKVLWSNFSLTVRYMWNTDNKLSYSSPALANLKNQHYEDDSNGQRLP